MNMKLIPWILALVLLAGGWLIGRMFTSGDEYGNLDVRTFQLEYIEPGAAHRVIDPYVFPDRGGMTSIDETTSTITVRETPEMLSRIEEVLSRYDVPDPGVKLQFRLVEANGGVTPDDERLTEIQDALPEGVFRFKNYRLLGETVMTGIEWSGVAQAVSTTTELYREKYFIEAGIGEVKATEDGGSVRLEVSLMSDQFGMIFRTAVNARFGQLLVLGSAQPDPSRGALILAVKPELVR
jgi:hypothetical protein